MRFFITVLCACLAFLVLSPGEALAWGPGAHMVMGNWILQNLSALPPVVAAALTRYPDFFLQGSLSADIFIGKGCVAQEGHSHNWESGLTLLARADKLRDKAYAYGYLAHLAADTVAHNVFVPGCFNDAPGNGRFAHIYLEIQADNLLKWDSRHAVGVFHKKGSRRAVRLLQESMGQNAYIFWAKKHIYEGSIRVGGSRIWRKSIQFFDTMLPEPVRRQWLDTMLGLSIRAIYSVLTDLDASPVLSLDPVGTHALAHAEEHRNGKSVLAQGVKGRLSKLFSRSASSPVCPENSRNTASGLDCDPLSCGELSLPSALIEKLPKPALVVPQLLSSLHPPTRAQEDSHE